jgi:hypothetical protein
MNIEKKKRTIKVNNQTCLLCEINDVTDGYSVCNNCSEELPPRICTCNKKLNEKPEIIIINGEYNKIEKIPQFYKFLKKWQTTDNKEYYILDGCRGCKFTKIEIETKYDIAEKSAITACIFKKFVNVGEIIDDIGNEDNENSRKNELNAMVYCGDSLDDNFVEYTKSIGGFNSECINLQKK